MKFKAIKLTLVILSISVLSSACTTTTEPAARGQGQQETEVIETPYVFPGIGLGGFSGPGLGSGGFFGGGIGVFEEEEEG